MKGKIFLTVLTLLLVANAASAQTGEPKTVRDFFMLLPSRYFGIECCTNRDARKSKQEYLKRYLNVEDTANGYLSGYGDAAQDGFVMTLFKRPNGTYLIGLYTYGEGGLEEVPWCVFLNYSKGKWTDVSRAVIPQYDPEKLAYELPRTGTTVGVFAKDETGEDFNKGKKLYDLIWKNGKFSIKK